MASGCGQDFFCPGTSFPNRAVIAKTELFLYSLQINVMKKIRVFRRWPASKFWFLIVLVLCGAAGKKTTPEVFLQPAKKFSVNHMPQSPQPGDDPFLENLLRKHPEQFGAILENPDSFRVQIIYTRIDRKQHNKPVFTDYKYRVNPEEYFYPASTVKMPVALLALQRIHELKTKGLTRNATMITGAAYSGQDEVYNDPTTPDGRPSIGHYIKKIFLVSDNDAYNRLYEFLGPEYINDHLHQMGYPSAAIIHRLERVLTEDENRHTNPVRFLDGQGKLLFEKPLGFYAAPYPARSEKLGHAYYRAGERFNGPMDFSRKNRLALQDLHHILRSILFPEDVPHKSRFHITPDDYRFVWKYMSQYPPETTFPSYDSAQQWDAYCKFLYWGSEKGPLPKTFRIFNKVGDAYGFLIDAAYIVDFERQIEFMLSAVIYCNSDGTLNDSRYDYDTVGFPFLKNLGRVIYAYERGRKRTHRPDLSAFRMVYEK